MKTVLPAALAAATFALIMALGIAFGAACADLWASQSIGEAGACSSHGGVARDPWPAVVLCAGLVAAGVYFFVRALGAPLSEPEKR